VMIEGFQNPSKYNYYTNSLKCFAYDTRYYRRTQFDIWPMEDSLQHKRVYFLGSNPVKGLTTDSINLPAGKWYGGWVNDTRTYQKVTIETSKLTVNATPGEKIAFDLSIDDPYAFPVNFSDSSYTHPVVLEACFFKGTDVISTQKAPESFNEVNLKPGQKTKYHFTVTAPPEKGSYELLFSLRTDPFPGGKNSRIIAFTVK